METTQKLLDRLRDAVSENKLKERSEAREQMVSILGDFMRPQSSFLEGADKAVILIVGVNGVGKTTSIGKIAAYYKAQGKDVMMAAADTFRAAAAEQLTVWAGGNHPMATTSSDSSFFDLPAESIRFVFDLNCLGSIIPSQVFGKYMAEQGSGCIINIASMSSFRPLTKTLAYSSAKAAIANFTEWAAVHFAQEYSPNIRGNAIAPGFLLTAQNHYLLKNEDGSDTDRGRSIITNTPMGRYGEPVELAGGVIFLCSDAAKFITGVVLPIDGGFNAFSGV